MDDDFGIDGTLSDWFLSLSVEERLATLQAWVTEIGAAQDALAQTNGVSGDPGSADAA